MSNTVINTNVSALNSHRSMKIVGESTGKSSEKLSSGLRINRAGDDAAGLAISEKMRSQIRGLNQASRNSQDGISLIQTAEGALQETEDMLQRMRELVVQAANDSNEQSDRDKIALELDELIDEIDATASKTEFNKKKLIDGSWGNEKLYFQVGANNNQSIEFNIEQMNSTLLGVTKEKISSVVKGETVTNNPTTVLDAGGTFTIDTRYVGSEPFADSVGTYEFANGASLTVSKDGNISFGGSFYTTSGLVDLSGVTTSEQLRTLIGNNKLFVSTGGNDVASEITVSSENVITITQTDGGAFLAGVKDQFDAFDDGTLAVPPGIDAGKVSLSNNTDFTASAMDQLADPAHENDSYVYFSRDVATNVLSYQFVFSETDPITFLDSNGEDISDKIKSGTLYSSDELLELGVAEVRGGNGVSFGFDPNYYGEHVTASIKEMVSFTKADSPGTSVGKEIAKLTDVLDNAIEKVSSQRAQLGAYQNRMEHTIRNLDTSSENLAAAESRIRDTDMAEEMMNFTKSNVLSQAAMSMLAQANQAPNNVLSLLR